MYSCSEINHITERLTAEAVIVILVQLQARSVILVERTPGHSVFAYGQAVAFGCFRHGNSFLDFFVHCHFHNPFVKIVRTGIALRAGNLCPPTWVMSKNGKYTPNPGQVKTDSGTRELSAILDGVIDIFCVSEIKKYFILEHSFDIIGTQ